MIILAAALLGFAASVPENIDVGEADWANYPRLETAELAIPSGTMVRRLQLMMQSGECTFEGQRARRFSVDINYAVRLDEQGNATQIIVEDVGCRPLELLVGRAVSDIVAQGHVRTPAPAEATIYSRRINFTLS